MTTFKKSKVDRTVQLTQSLSSSRLALHWQRDKSGHVIKSFQPLKPYQYLQK
ncbi:hypothetical protein [Aliivibrio fischeri]|uniref:hypothetical protein n=1 Tax=Aliivibrio fischeri TaxID=668 RepID=UPI0012DA22DA|nr:hypothetical protein [Aliivibrio fischeri]MUJ27984.1 hypothetical protein [Aliivibrio fischeri]